MKVREGVTVGNHSDVGQVRSQNEDYFAYYEPDDDQQYARYGRLTIVADGMGGMAGGYDASRTAVEVVRDEYFKSAADDPQDRLRYAIEAANAEIFKRALKSPELKGMGTTMTALLLLGDRAYIGHVGDSRAYLLRDDAFQQITQDHTKVARMLAQGIITPEEAKDHPEGNVLSQAVGHKEAVEVETSEVAGGAKQGDRFLLCSDGLHGLISDSEMADLAAAHPPNAACRALTDLANQRGGHDNITVQILHVGGDSAVALRRSPRQSPVTRREMPYPPALDEDAHPPGPWAKIVLGALLLLVGLVAGYFLFAPGAPGKGAVENPDFPGTSSGEPAQTISPKDPGHEGTDEPGVERHRGEKGQEVDDPGRVGEDTHRPGPSSAPTGQLNEPARKKKGVKSPPGDKKKVHSKPPSPKKKPSKERKPGQGGADRLDKKTRGG